MTTPPGTWVTLSVVGAGTLLPSTERGSASFHIRSGGAARDTFDRGHGLLLDAGAGTLHGLPRAGVEWRTIDTVAVTHFHPDHISDLPALFAAYRYEGIEAPLNLVGPPGLKDLLDRMAALHGPWILEPSRPLNVVEISEGDVWSPPDGTLRLRVHDTPHTPESVAYRVEVVAGGPPRAAAGLPESAPSAGSAGATKSAGSAVIGYTGDTGPSESLSRFLRGCHVVVAECSLADPPTMETHLSPSGVGAMASIAQPEVLLVSHVYPPQTPDQAVEAVRAAYSGRVEAARDGGRVHIRPSGVTLVPVE